MTTAQPQYAPGSPEAFLATCQPVTLKPNEVNLVDETRALLVKHGATPEQLMAFDNNWHIHTAKDLTTEIQRYKLNLFLNGQYSSLQGDISVHRGYIITGVGVDMWLKMMDTYHIPTMLRLKLPIPM